MTKFILITSAIFFNFSSAQAAPFTLPQLDATQVDSVFRTMAATSVFKPLQGADTFANIFGIAAGVTGSMTSTGPMGSLVPGTSFVYAADINGAIQLPLGIAFEIGILPNLNLNGANISRIGGDVKYTFIKSPVALAVRGIYTNTSVTYSQAVSGGTVNVSYNSNIYGASLAVSKSLVFVEPYMSYGLLSHSSTLGGSGTSNLFNGTVPGQTASGTGTSGFFELGAEFKLTILTLAAEYNSSFGADGYAARVGLKF